MENNQIQQYKSKLVSDFPQLDIQSVKLIGTGWHHVALEVNSSIIFRLPREVHVKDLSSTVQYETKILNRLRNKIPVAIPDPQYIAPNGSYFGYPKLDGVILDTIISEFKNDDWKQLLKDWVDTASKIHTEITVDEARKYNVPDFDGFDTSMAEKIFNLEGIDQTILDFANNTIQQVKALKDTEQQWVFIHNDLQFHNLLANRVSKRLSGVIDWTDVCIAPVAREFATGELMKGDLLQQAIELYGKKTGIRIDKAQAIMWRSIEELSDYVEEIESNELNEAAETLERIKLLMDSRL